MREQLLGKTPVELKDIALKVGLPAFTGKQIAQWMYGRKVRSIDEMTNISKAGRERLKEEYSLGVTLPSTCQVSSDGTKKYLFPVGEGNAVEAGMIPDEDRKTLCVSSQAGCRMGCKFCMTGRQGFHGNLTVADILSQFIAIDEAAELTNAVFMGMGEPLANTKNLFKAIETINSYKGFNLGIRHITISTSGEIVGIKQLIEKDLDCRLAVSLHSLKNEVRDKIMPINKKYPIENLISILKRYSKNGKRMITFEWVLMKDINDSVNDAYRIVNLKKEFPFKVNIIPMNPVEHAPELKKPNKDIILRFKSILKDNGVEVIERFKQGQDILAGCGQLAIKDDN